MSLIQLYLLSILFFLSSILSAQHQVLDNSISSLDKDLDMKTANWSITVLDASSGQLITSHQPYKCLPTASTMKAITSATALAVLGPDYQFKTFLEYTGSISEKGVLNGNIYIRGTGDPSLGSNRFESLGGPERLISNWVEAIKKAGIIRIEGKIIGDASCFSTQLTPGNWNWEDMGNYYGAGASGLSFMENEYTLYLKPGPSAGNKTNVLRTHPNLNGITFINELVTGSARSGDQAYIYGAPYTHLRYLRGSIPSGRNSFSIRGSLPEPALTCAQALEEQLTVCSILVTKGISTMRLENIANVRFSGTRKQLHISLSPPLKEIIKPLNLKSINVYAECLLLATAMELAAKGRTQEATEEVESYWEGKDIEIKGMRIRDGSGLSPNNAVSTYQMANILSKVYNSSYSDDFRNSLPVAGRSGSLKSMFGGSPAAGRLMAKSGYISGTRAYAGYVKLSSGKVVSFAVIANNYSCSDSQMRRKLETLMSSIAQIK